MSSSHRELVQDPEEGTLDVVLPSEISPRRLPSSPSKEGSGSSTPKTAISKASSEKLADSKDEKAIVVTEKVVPVTEKPEKPGNAAKPPAKKSAPRGPQWNRASRWIRFKIWYNTYRKFFTFIIIMNCIGIVLALTGTWMYPRHYTTAFILGNLNVSILVRNEIFGRFLYWFVKTFFNKWPPLWFRLGCTSTLQHLGGIHSGCAVSGCLWLMYHLALIFIDRKDQHDSILVWGVITNVLVAGSITSGLPWVRNTHHNAFERPHRFIGWSGVVSSWVLTGLTKNYDKKTHQWNLDKGDFFRTQDFWYVLGMTVFIGLPWLCTRHVEVEVQLPSPKVAVLKFKRGMQQGLLARISRRGVWEYHAFGTISEGTQADCHYLICGVQGDFTKSLVANPPKKIWTRELKFAGVGNTSAIYKRGIRVCTGTGLGAALSTCLQSPNWYLIWIGSDQEKTFGPTISGLIHNNLGPERVCLWDSKQRGSRPDVMKLVRDAYKEWNAEIVFITSNFQGNAEIMEGCKESGIPVFGTLWDF